jgi:lipopolysaccharide transport system ATP-binding protein
MTARHSISAAGLGKAYALQGAHHTTLVDVARERLRHPLHSRRREQFWALRDLSFDVDHGEAVGVIGANGAGKTTLLKILSRVTEPTTGEARLNGRVGSLLEVGTGFHQELTGRENIFLNGSILGMRKSEIRAQFPAIVEFAGVSKFLDTPVKRYSSGMAIRLAFAVAAHLNPEILIVDEVLAVGDAEFQKQCLGKMGEVAGTGSRTVLFVSHNMAAVETLCTRCIVLRHGEMIFDGSPTEAIAAYLQTLPSSDDGVVVDLSKRVNHGHHLILRSLAMYNSAGAPATTLRAGEGFTLEIEVEQLTSVPGANVGFDIRSEFDQTVTTVQTKMRPPDGKNKSEREKLVCEVKSLPLVPGTYWISVGVANQKAIVVDEVIRATSFTVVATDLYGSGHQLRSDEGLIFLDFDWHREEVDRSSRLGLVAHDQ